MSVSHEVRFIVLSHQTRCSFAPDYFSVSFLEIAQLTSSDSGIAETPETDDSVSA